MRTLLGLRNRLIGVGALIVISMVVVWGHKLLVWVFS